MSRNTQILLGVVIAGVFLACCCGLIVVATAGAFIYQFSSSSVSVATAIRPRVTVIPVSRTPAAPPSPRPATLTPLPDPSATAPDLAPSATPLPGAGADTLAAIAGAQLPPRDLREVAMRLKGLPDIPATVAAAPADHAVGAVLEFNAHNDDTQEHFTVRARLVYKTANAYFFAEQGVNVNEAAVRRLLDDFQAQTYPTNREFFGSEWTPGVDGDPRLYILYVRGIGFGTLGYYSSADEYSRLAYEYSNEKEIFYINADLTTPGDSDLASTLTHEFQHMIHWHQDLNEETWLNEGASMLAELLNDYRPDGYAFDFIADPDLQLNAWTDGNTIPHYGASFMFLAYFLDRFGEAATRALVSHPENGLVAVDAVLAEVGATDPASGQPLTAEDVFADWVVANYLDDPAVADGRYTYRRYADPLTVSPLETYFTCPVARQTGTVNQFGSDYYRFDCPGTFTLSFAGDSRNAVAPAPPLDGRYAFWSHRADETVTALTRAFDLTGLTTATLTYRAWWDIEEYYDYAYLQISANGGETWTILRAPSSTDEDPNSASFGWGYTGASRGWRDETVDLSAYAGQQVLVRFEYVTDTALNNPGLLVDDIALPELDYRADFEQDEGGWEAQGFVRMDNVLPQRFILQLIRQSEAGTTVERVPLDGGNRGQLPVTVAPGETVTLVVSGATRFTTESAEYEFALER